MNLEQELRNDILILRPRGRLDSSSSPELERVVTEQLDSGIQRLVFDLSGLDYISSAGLRVVLLAGKKLRTSKGKLVLVGLRDMVREIVREELQGALGERITRNVRKLVRAEINRVMASREFS